MNKEDQGKKTSPVVSDAAVEEVIPANPDKPTALSDEDLDKVAGGGGDSYPSSARMGIDNDNKVVGGVAVAGGIVGKR